MANDYSKTVHLPVTRFPMKGDLPKREPGTLDFWQKSGVYQKMVEQSAKAPPYVLHDGPPYANGHIHIGHSLNKVLKDMVVKSHAVMGHQTPLVFGWDCHGLPIEQALLKELKMDKRGVKDIPAFRAKASEFAEKFIDIQRAEFKRLGVMGDWDHPYVTMAYEFEARVIRAFRLLYQKGYIYRGLKAVTWCIYCETALAEAEVEYKDKTSPSVYVALRLRSSSALKSKGLESGTEVLVWTTTPWTLPANMAVAFHPDLEYVLAETTVGAEANPRRLLLAKARLEAVLKEIKGTAPKILGSWKGSELAPAGRESSTVSLAAEAPFGGRESVGVLADYVTAEDGTGIVHTAPGHGADDFETGQRYGLKILSPIDGSGRFTQEASQFLGKRVFDEGNPAVIEALKVDGRLLGESKIQHSYPHCWRCKNPIVFRATEQWFLNINHSGLRDRLLKAIGEVRWIPEAGQSRISAMVSGRPDWCLSRQRVWGTPIPILYCVKCSHPLGDDPVLLAIEQRVEREGDDFWFQEWGKPVYMCTPSGDIARRAAAQQNEAVVWDFMPAEISCSKCKHRVFRRETDILDVWVDSGASWLAVLEWRKQHPCDIYLEGSDQHRGWFQSSLVLSVALTEKAPYKTVLTHGFVLDDQGRAMHKSLGNVVSPRQVIDKFGADVLRLWVALADYSDDVRLSDKLLEGPTEAYRKVRNTLRYLLGNTFDFDPAKNSVDFKQMPELDRYLLHRLCRTVEDTLLAYKDFKFRAAARTLIDFCNLDLSSFYLDASKDRLYTLATDSPLRRSAQTVLYECLHRLLPLLAPILSFTAEEAWQEIKRMLDSMGNGTKLPESVFLYPLPEIPSHWSDAELAERWKVVLEVRSRVNRAIEAARASGTVGGSLQAKVRLAGGQAERPILEAYKDQWPEILLVSQAEVNTQTGDLRIEVQKADGSKCARCWRFQTDVGSSAKYPELCSRCVQQLSA